MPTRISMAPAGARLDAAIPMTVRLLALVGLATGFPLVLLLLQIRTDAADAEERATARAGWVAHRVAADVGLGFAVVDGAAQTLQRLDDFWEGTDTQRDDILLALSSAHPFLGELTFFTSDLQQHGSSTSEPGAYRPSLAGHPQAVETVRTHQPAFSDQALVGSNSSKLFLPMALPIQEDGARQRVGYLAAAFRIDQLTQLWRDVALLDRTSLFVVDSRSGKVIDMTATDATDQQVLTWPDISGVLAGDSVFHARDASGADLLIGWEQIPNTPWVVFVEVPTEALFGPVRAQAIQHGAVPVAVSVLLGALVLLAWRRVARLQSDLAQRGRELEQLVGRLFSAQEEERRRVAYEVHDGLAQVAAATHQRLESLAAVYQPRTPRTRQDLQRARELARRTVAEARRIIAGLRPAVLDDFGLCAALELEAEQMRAEGWAVQLDSRLDGQRLSNAADLALYRVAQEALTNIRKHAAASRVRINLRVVGSSVRLTVADDGAGFDPMVLDGPASAGYRVGLPGMRERLALMGGRCEVISRFGGGTTVTAELPSTEMEGEVKLAS